MRKNNEIRRILAAVDGSEVSYKALEQAMDLARLKDAELLIVYAFGDSASGNVPPVEGGTQYRGVPIPKVESIYDEARIDSERWIQQLVEKAEVQGVKKATGEVLFAPRKSTVELITDYAKDNQVDLIVMGTTGKGTFKRLLIGSVANGVLHHAPCSVFVVR
jgi:nucleotide-binding universal stress UspA family protein